MQHVCPTRSAHLELFLPKTGRYMRLRRSNIYLLIVTLIATTMAFYHIGRHDLSEWDESRNGENAYEMLHNGDFINLYYAGQPDTWNAKPPLMTWCIAGSYYLFGFNEFALRLPAALCTIAFFIVFFMLISRLEGGDIAFACCLVLCSCKAIFGIHIGITGDYDAMLLLLLTLSAYYFIIYIEAEHRNSNGILLTGLFTGLAFYTKGPAAFLYIPGFLVYAIYRGRFRNILKDIRTWFAVLILIVSVLSWAWLILNYGAHSAHSFYGTHNAFETMFLKDTYKRMTSTNFEAGRKADYLFLFKTLDSKLNLWNYLFYLSIASGLYLLYKKRHRLKAFLSSHKMRSVVFAVCMTAPLCILLTFAATKYDWYLAPVWGFLVLILVRGIFYLSRRWRPLLYVAALLLVFTLVRQFVYLATLPADMHDLFSNKNQNFARAGKVVAIGQPRQNAYLYLKWLNKPIILTDSIDKAEPQDIVILHDDKMDVAVKKTIKPLQHFQDYTVAVYR
jgi:4-amino-4-deoxy-L-arabinose transferase-like glycosyltransferase